MNIDAGIQVGVRNYRGLERTGQERTGQRWKKPDKFLPSDNMGKNRTSICNKISTQKCQKKLRLSFECSNFLMKN